MNTGFEGIIGIIVMVLIVYGFVSAFKNRGIVHLALSKFTIDPEAEDQIIIEGRKTGLMQWILVKLNLGNTFKIHIKNDHITYSADSAAGQSLTLVPLAKVSSTSCGYSKPIGLFFLAILFVIIAIGFIFVSVASAMMCIGLAAIFFVVYVYSKNFFITIETFGSSQLGFSFKRSYIENVPIDISQIEEAIRHLNKIVIENE